MVEAGGDFVVLLVRGSGLLGERTRLQIGDVSGAIVDGGVVADALGEQAADTDPEESVGEKIFFEETVDHGIGFVRRSHHRSPSGESTSKIKRTRTINFERAGVFSETTEGRRSWFFGSDGRRRRGTGGFVRQFYCRCPVRSR